MFPTTTAGTTLRSRHDFEQAAPVTDPHDRPPHVAFVLEQHLGHLTLAQNLRSALESDQDVSTTWIDVDYAPTDHWWERVPSGSARDALRCRSEVDAGLAAIAPDAIVYNTQVPAVLGGSAARRTPYVLCMDDTPILKDEVADIYGVPSDRPGPVKWLKHRWNRSVFQRASALAPWSEWAAGSLVRDYGIDPARIEVIPPGVDTASWPVAEHRGDATGPLKLLFVGGDFERKGGQVLLDALREQPSGSVEAHVVTTADVDAPDGVVVHHGLRPGDRELIELFRSSDVFVLPSRFEMFGIAAVEAAAAGLPVVLSAVGGLGELVQDEVTGLAVEPDDRAGLANAIATLREQPELRLRLGRAARARAEAEFDAGTNARRLVDLAVRCADRDGS